MQRYDIFLNGQGRAIFLGVSRPISRIPNSRIIYQLEKQLFRSIPVGRIAYMNP